MKEKEHGLFTYYVLKGLGGDADNNQDKKLTIGELGKYVQVKVKEQAAIEGREQIPELQGDTEKVLVQWWRFVVLIEAKEWLDKFMSGNPKFRMIIFF